MLFLSSCAKYSLISQFPFFCEFHVVNTCSSSPLSLIQRVVSNNESVFNLHHVFAATNVLLAICKKNSVVAPSHPMLNVFQRGEGR